jgi:hypothetical protein
MLSLWLLAALHGVVTGWQLPSSAPAQSFPKGEIGLILAVVPVALFSIAGLRNYSPTRLPYAFLEAPIDRIFGPGLYRRAILGLGVAAWLGLIAILSGVIGFVRVLQTQSSDSARNLSLLCLSAGVGMLIQSLQQQRRYARNENEA